MHKYFNPNRFLKIINKLFIPIIIITIIANLLGLYFVIISPNDYQQGEFVKIMYIHVPSAWMALFIYANIAFASIAFLIWKNPISDIVAYSSSVIGAIFAFACLVTGSIWGENTWGTYWVWDARLTSMLILFFLYIGYIILHKSYKNSNNQINPANYLAIIGVINLPIIKFSVDIWNSLHQPASVLRSGGIAIDPSMQKPLFLMAIGFLGIYLIALIINIKTEILRKKLFRNDYK